MGCIITFLFCKIIFFIIKLNLCLKNTNFKNIFEVYDKIILIYIYIYIY